MSKSLDFGEHLSDERQTILRIQWKSYNYGPQYYLHQGMIVSYTAVFVPSPKLTFLRDKEGFVGDEEDHEDARDFHLSFLEKKIESNAFTLRVSLWLISIQCPSRELQGLNDVECF